MSSSYGGLSHTSKVEKAFDVDMISKGSIPELGVFC